MESHAYSLGACPGLTNTASGTGGQPPHVKVVDEFASMVDKGVKHLGAGVGVEEHISSVSRMAKFRYQSLLMQLLHPTVRRDLVDGRLYPIPTDGEGFVDIEDVVLNIDLIRQIVVPKWRASRVSMDVLSRDADACLTQLYRQSDAVLDLGIEGTLRWTYARWSHLLETIATST